MNGMSAAAGSWPFRGWFLGWFPGGSKHAQKREKDNAGGTSLLQSPAGGAQGVGHEPGAPRP